MILFLDLDGVLNNHVLHENGYSGLRKENVDLFNNVIKMCPEMRIVISSAWRYLIINGMMKLKGFESMLLTHGLDCKDRIVNHTQSDEITRGKNPQWDIRLDGEAIRRQQIYDFTRKTGLRRFVVLDDLDLKMPELIKTTPTVGLTKEQADSLIEILNK